MGIRGNWLMWRRCVIAMSVLLYPAFAMAEDPMVGQLERRAQTQFVAGNFGAADENIRAAIGLAANDEFNRLALLQGLIATRLGSDGRSLLGAAVAAHDDPAWPRPVISYLLGERKLQQVADSERRSRNSALMKRQHICELSFYAGAFARADEEHRFAKQLLEKALDICDRDSPIRAMTNAELAVLAAR